MLSVKISHQLKSVYDLHPCRGGLKGQSLQGVNINIAVSFLVSNPQEDGVQRHHVRPVHHERQSISRGARCLS